MEADTATREPARLADNALVARRGFLARELRGRKLSGSDDVRPRFSVVGFCFRREVAYVFECLLSGEPASDRKGVNGETEERDGKDVPAEREHVAGAVEAD
jgi:hypothetical protein